MSTVERRVLSLWTQTILPPIVTAVLFLAVFGGALGHRIHRVEGIPYLSFILPGLLVMTVAGQASSSPASASALVDADPDRSAVLPR
jgi:ABC-2 type transport system permease protein